jgi:hypothetical protein
LEQAVVLQSVKMVELILGAGADMESCDEMGNSILMRTIGYGAPVMVEMARMFIDSGARVDAKNIQDMTALMYAAEYKTAPMVALLLASGADVDLRDCNGKSALDYASHDIRRIGKEGDGDTGSNSKECELMISSYQASQSLKTDLRLKNDAKASMAAGMGKVKVKV